MSKGYRWKAMFNGDRYFIDEDDTSSTEADDPWFMDVVGVNGQWWLCQYDVGYVNNFTEGITADTPLLGPYPTLDEAKTVAEMMYETLVVKT